MVNLGGLTPEPTEFTVLFALCGGMGTGPLRTVGARGSMVLGFLSMDSTGKKQLCQYEAKQRSTQTYSSRSGIFLVIILSCVKNKQ